MERGLRADIPGVIDESSGFFFDMGYTVDKDGNVKFYDVALCRVPDSPDEKGLRDGEKEN